MTEHLSKYPEITQRYELAIEISRSAGKLLLDIKKTPEVHRKVDSTFVTNADLAINQLFIEAIQSEFPEDTIIGEEQELTPEITNQYRWYVDPIDGTADFVRGGNDHGIATALTVDNEILFGSFYNPNQQELFVARRGMGALLNGKPIHVNNELYRPGMDYDYCDWPGAPISLSFFEETIGPSLGQYSISNQACRVAQGISTFTVFPGKLHHDILPGAIIVEEAGGNVSDIYGEALNISAPSLNYTIYSNGIVHDAVRSALAPQL